MPQIKPRAPCTPPKYSTSWAPFPAFVLWELKQKKFFSRVYGLSSFHEMNHDNIIVYKISHLLGARLLLTSQPGYSFQRKLILYQDLSETRRQSTKFSSGNICQTVWPAKQLVCVPGSQASSLWVLPSCLLPEDSQPSFSWVINVCHHIELPLLSLSEGFGTILNLGNLSSSSSYHEVFTESLIKHMVTTGVWRGATSPPLPPPPSLAG